MKTILILAALTTPALADFSAPVKEAPKVTMPSDANGCSQAFGNVTFVKVIGQSADHKQLEVVSWNKTKGAWNEKSRWTSAGRITERGKGKCV